MRSFYSIENVKTWNGRRWAIVDINRNQVIVDGNVAQFSNDKAGLEQARRILKELKKQVPTQ